MKRLVVTLALLPAPLAACSSADPGTRPAPDPGNRPAAEAVAARFTERANAGDKAGVRDTFAENARFDSAGRIYANRNEIMRRFLVPEVLEAGGKYHARGQEWDGGRLVVHYRYETGSGGSERFTYSYLIRDGLVQDVIGRYE